MGYRFLGALLACALVFSAAELSAQSSREADTVRQAETVLQEILEIPAEGIPRAMLRDARGVAVIPNVVKGSFVVGARHGKGVLLTRNERGEWNAPVFISITGGSVGWQIGVQATDLILVFKTQKSIDGILSGKFTLGADAAVAAGPVGRQAAAATDGKLRAEIYSYSRSRGLFAGVSLDGSAIQVDHTVGAAYYRDSRTGEPAIPPESLSLVEKVAAYASGVDPAPTEGPTPAPAVGEGEAAAVRAELARQADALYRVLDPTWRQFLAVPPEMFREEGEPAIEALRASMANFDRVAADPQYRELAARADFQATAALLRRYIALRTRSASGLTLPPPPRR